MNYSKLHYGQTLNELANDLLFLPHRLIDVLSLIIEELRYWNFFLKTNTKFKYPFFENTPKYVINKYIEIFLLVKYLSHVLSIRRKFLDLKNHNWITGNESLIIWCYTVQLRVFSIPLVVLIWGMLIYRFPISMFQISDKY